MCSSDLITADPERKYLTRVDITAQVVGKVQYTGNLDFDITKPPPPTVAGETLVMPESALVWLTADQLTALRTGNPIPAPAPTPRPAPDRTVPAPASLRPRGSAKPSLGLGGVTTTLDLSGSLGRLRTDLATHIGDEAANRLLPQSGFDTKHNNHREITRFLSDVNRASHSLVNGGKIAPLRLDDTRFSGQTYEFNAKAGFQRTPGFNGITHVDKLKFSNSATLTTSGDKIRGFTPTGVTVSGRGVLTLRDVPDPLPEGTPPPRTGHGPANGGMGAAAGVNQNFGDRTTKETQKTTTAFEQSGETSGPVARYGGNLQVELTITRHNETVASTTVTEPISITKLAEDTLPPPQGIRHGRGTHMTVPAVRRTPGAMQAWRGSKADGSPAPTFTEGTNFTEHYLGDIEALRDSAVRALRDSGVRVTPAAERAIRAAITPAAIKAGMPAIADGTFRVPLPKGLDRTLELHGRIPRTPRFAGTSGTVKVDGSRKTTDEHKSEIVTTSGPEVTTTIPAGSGGVNGPAGADSLSEGRTPFGSLAGNTQRDATVLKPAPDSKHTESATTVKDKSATPKSATETKSDEKITRTVLSDFDFRFVSRQTSKPWFGSTHTGASELQVRDAYVIRLRDDHAQTLTARPLPQSLKDATTDLATKAKAWSTAHKETLGAQAAVDNTPPTAPVASTSTAPTPLTPEQVALRAAQTKEAKAEKDWWTAFHTHQQEVTDEQGRDGGTPPRPTPRPNRTTPNGAIELTPQPAPSTSNTRTGESSNSNGHQQTQDQNGTQPTQNPRGETSGNQTQDQTTQDRRGETSGDQVTQDRRGETSGDQTSGDQSTQDQITQDQTTQDQVTQDQVTRVQTTQDQGGQDRPTLDQGSQDQGSQDQGSQDRDGVDRRGGDQRGVEQRDTDRSGPTPSPETPPTRIPTTQDAPTVGDSRTPPPRDTAPTESDIDDDSDAQSFHSTRQTPEDIAADTDTDTDSETDTDDLPFLDALDNPVVDPGDVEVITLRDPSGQVIGVGFPRVGEEALIQSAMDNGLTDQQIAPGRGIPVVVHNTGNGFEVRRTSDGQVVHLDERGFMQLVLANNFSPDSSLVLLSCGVADRFDGLVRAARDLGYNGDIYGPDGPIDLSDRGTLRPHDGVVFRGSGADPTPQLTPFDPGGGTTTLGDDESMDITDARQESTNDSGRTPVPTLGGPVHDFTGAPTDQPFRVIRERTADPVFQSQAPTVAIVHGGGDGSGPDTGIRERFRYPVLTHDPAQTPLRVAGDGTVAIGAAAEPKEFFATPAVLDRANRTLSDVGSLVRLEGTTTEVVVGGAHLVRVRPVLADGTDTGRDPFVSLLRSSCISVANRIMGSPYDQTSTVFLRSADASFSITPRSTADERILDLAHRLTVDTAPTAALTAATVAAKQPGRSPDASLRYATALRQGTLAGAAAELGINEHAWARPGEGYGIFSMLTPDDVDHSVDPPRPVDTDNVWGYHFEAVVAESDDGRTVVTLANYSRLDFDAVLRDRLYAELHRQAQQRGGWFGALPRLAPGDDLSQFNAKFDQVVSRLVTDPEIAKVGGLVRQRLRQDFEAHTTRSWFFSAYGRDPGQGFHDRQVASGYFANPLTVTVRRPPVAAGAGALGSEP